MDKETLQKIKHVERALEDVDKKMRSLVNEREVILTEWDEEYGGYVEAYRLYYDDEPLSIRAYYKASEEMQAINALWNNPNADYDALYQKYKSEIQRLERILAA